MIWEAVPQCSSSKFKYFLPYLDVLTCGMSSILCLGPYLNRLNKLTIFHSFILSNFNFCPLAWHFCTDKNSKKIEKVQERALRFVYEDYNKLSPSCLHNLVHLQNSKYYFRYNNILDIPQVRTSRYGKKKHLNLLLLHCGTASQTISGLKTVFLNLRA
jgi:hypothetical protein